MYNSSGYEPNRLRPEALMSKVEFQQLTSTYNLKIPDQLLVLPAWGWDTCTRDHWIKAFFEVVRKTRKMDTGQRT